MRSFSSTLENDTSDFILFSLGAGAEKTQEIPSYINRISKQFQDKKISIYSIDLSIDSAKKQISKNVFLYRFKTFIPVNSSHFIVNILENFIAEKLNLGKIVLIGNHTRGVRFRDVAIFTNVFLKLKKSHKNKDNIILYNQVCGNCWYVFLPPKNDKLYKIYESDSFFYIDRNDDTFGFPAFIKTEKIQYTCFNEEGGVDFKIEKYNNRLKVTGLSGQFQTS
jgi:hypothetical protein